MYAKWSWFFYFGLCVCVCVCVCVCEFFYLHSLHLLTTIQFKTAPSRTLHVYAIKDILHESPSGNKRQPLVMPGKLLWLDQAMWEDAWMRVHGWLQYDQPHPELSIGLQNNHIHKLDCGRQSGPGCASQFTEWAIKKCMVGLLDSYHKCSTDAFAHYYNNLVLPWMYHTWPLSLFQNVIHSCSRWNVYWPLYVSMYNVRCLTHWRARLPYFLEKTPPWSDVSPENHPLHTYSFEAWAHTTEVLSLCWLWALSHS